MLLPPKWLLEFSAHLAVLLFRPKAASRPGRLLESCLLVAAERPAWALSRPALAILRIIEW